MTDQLVAESYGAKAGAYIELFGSLDAVHADDLAMIRRWAEPLRGLVLDVGCGPGHLSGYLHSLGVEVRGLDLAVPFIAHARASYPELVFELGSMVSLGVKDGSLAGILAWYSVIHLEPGQLDAALVGFRRALAPGGALLVAFFAADTVEVFAHKVVSAHAWPVAEMRRRLRVAGFDVEESCVRLEVTGRSHAAVMARAGGKSSPDGVAPGCAERG